MAWVLDPASGRIVQVPDDSRAATMTAQAQQPVYGPRNPPPGVSNQTQFGPGAFDVQTPVANALSGVGTAPTTNAPSVRFGMNVQAPAATTAAPTVTAPAPVAPVVVQPAPAPVGVEPAPALMTDQDRASINAQIAASLAAQRPDAPIYQPAERGNYNQYNTNVAALPKPVGEGLNFGFGVNGAPTARQVLDRYAAQDAQAVIDQRTRLQEATQAAELSRLRDVENDPVKFRRQLRVVQALAPQTQASQQQQGDLAGLQLRGRTAQQVAELQAGTTLQQQTLANQGRLDAADLTGRYGVEAANIRGQAALTTAAAKMTGPEAQKAAVEAALLQTRLNAIQAGLAANQLDNAGVIAATRSGQEPAARVYIDPLTGAPLSEAQIALLQQQQLRQLQPTQ